MPGVHPPITYHIVKLNPIKQICLTDTTAATGTTYSLTVGHFDRLPGEPAETRTPSAQIRSSQSNPLAPQTMPRD